MLVQHEVENVKHPNHTSFKSWVTIPHGLRNLCCSHLVFQHFEPGFQHPVTTSISEQFALQLQSRSQVQVPWAPHIPVGQKVQHSSDEFVTLKRWHEEPRVPTYWPQRWLIWEVIWEDWWERWFLMDMYIYTWNGSVNGFDWWKDLPKNALPQKSTKTILSFTHVGTSWPKACQSGRCHSMRFMRPSWNCHPVILQKEPIILLIRCNCFSAIRNTLEVQ